MCSMQLVEHTSHPCEILWEMHVPVNNQSSQTYTVPCTTHGAEGAHGAGVNALLRPVATRHIAVASLA
jgi:hypothetical protein